MRRALAAALLSLALAASAPARASAAFADLGLGARGVGMGNAFVPIADDVYTLYYNPAGLALLDRPEFGTAYTRYLLGLTDNSNLNSSFLGYAQPLKDEWGTAAVGWQQFDLSGLYQEQTFFLGYGRALARDLGPGDLYGGANLKMLRRSFDPGGSAGNAFNDSLIATGQADPVLAAKHSMTAPDIDVGLLYRMRENYSAGLSLSHVTQPNIAFSPADTDKLPMNVKLGLGYRSLLSNIAAQYETVESPIGTQDQRFTVGAERWFPWLLVGNVGVRGALSFGSREYKQLSTGASYQSRRFRVDYAFVLPINGMPGQGSHQFSFSIRFGSAKEPDESVTEVLAAMRRIKEGTVPAEVAVKSQGLSESQRVLLEEQVTHARALALEAQYAKAAASLSKALALGPEDPKLLKSFGRLNFVATLVPELPNFKADPVQAAWHQGIMSYLAYDDAAAVDKLSYALSLAPESHEIDVFLSQLELATGLKRKELPKATPAALEVDRLLTQAATAIQEGRYNDVISLAEEVLKRDPDNVSAFEDLGIAYFAQSDYPASAAAWEKALALEKDPVRRALLETQLKSVRNLMKRPQRAAPKTPTGAVPVERVQQLYSQGLDYYAAGQLDKARAVLEQALSLDPQNTEVRKALNRVQEELRSH